VMHQLLKIKGLAKRFGGLTALKSVDMNAGEGELLGLIGPNGSGKTTLLNIVSGYYKADAGRIAYQGRAILGDEPHQLARLGIGRSFQVTKIFKRLTVMENMLVAGLSDAKAARGEARDRAEGLLRDLKLDRLRDERASSISGGQGKLLEFARIMMLSPKIVLLDEPFGGVHPELKQFMHDQVRKWNASGTAIILISHDMGSIFDLCGRVVTLSNGDIICDGTPEKTRNDPAVLDAYLGDHHGSA